MTPQVPESPAHLDWPAPQERPAGPFSPFEPGQPSEAAHKKSLWSSPEPGKPNSDSVESPTLQTPPPTSRFLGCIPAHPEPDPHCARKSRRIHLWFFWVPVSFVGAEALLVLVFFALVWSEVVKAPEALPYIVPLLGVALFGFALKGAFAVFSGYVLAKWIIVLTHSMNAIKASTKWGILGFLGSIALLVAFHMFNFLGNGAFSSSGLSRLGTVLLPIAVAVVCSAVASLHSVVAQPHKSFVSSKWVDKPGYRTVTLQVIGGGVVLVGVVVSAIATDPFLMIFAAAIFKTPVG